MPIRLLLADDHPLILTGLTQLFGNERDIEIVADARDGEEAMTAVRRERPDVAVLDVRMPRLSAIKIAQQIAVEKLPTRVILLTASITDSEVVEALGAEVKGIILKEMALPSLVKAVREVFSGTQLVYKGLSTQALETLLAEYVKRRHMLTLLTAREIEVIQLVARGLKNREIARMLSVTEGTIKIHLGRVYEKLAVTNRVELTNLARAERLGDLGPTGDTSIGSPRASSIGQER